MSYYNFNETETFVWNFLQEQNMSCNPDKWDDGYKDFIRHCRQKISFSEFSDTLVEFRNYYNCIHYSFDEDDNFTTYSFSKTFKPSLYKNNQE